ncbi:PilZ domain-containing protein [bacterium]|nr:PilZ domain-containing protein [bacterium]
MKEKRKFPRIKLNAKVIVFDANNIAHCKDKHAQIVDISEAGVCFQSGISFYQGEKCLLEMVVNNKGTVIKIMGIIRRAEQNPYLSTYGIYILKINLLDKFALKRLMQTRKGKALFLSKPLILGGGVFILLGIFIVLFKLFA